MSFADEMSRFARAAMARTDAVARATVVETGARLIARSPVATGHFRGNWQLGIDAAPSGEIDTGGANGRPAPPPEIPAIASASKGRRFFWVNNTPYADDLEVGRGGRPPLGLTTLAAIEFPAVVAAAAKNAGAG